MLWRGDQNLGRRMGAWGCHRALWPSWMWGRESWWRAEGQWGLGQKSSRGPGGTHCTHVSWGRDMSNLLWLFRMCADSKGLRH